MFNFLRTYFLATTIGFLTSLITAQAATRTWTNVGTTDWGTAANWSGGIPTAADVANFNAATTVLTPNLDSNQSVLGITLNNTDSDYSFTQTSGPRSLTIGASGLSITGGGVTTIDPVISLGVGQTWNTGNTDLTLAGGLNIAGDSTVLTLTGAATLLKVTGNVTTLNAAWEIRLGGQGSMVVSGSLGAGVSLESHQQFTGTLTLSGNNSAYNTDIIFWRAGNLNISSANALGTGTSLNLGSSNSAAGINILTTGAYTVSRNVIVQDNNLLDVGKSYVIGGNQTTGTSVYSGSINLGGSAIAAPVGGLSVTSAAGGVVDFSGQITGTQATASSGRISKITKIGDGVVRFTLAAGNSYTGGTEITAGILLANNTSNSATGSGAVLVGPSGTLGGTGTVGLGTAVVTVNGTLSPGDSTVNDTRDMLTINGSLTLNPTANTLLQIASLADFDKVNVIGTGAVTLDGTIHLDFATFAASNFASNFTLDVFDWTTINATGFNVATDLFFDNVNTGGNLGSWDLTNFTTNGSFSWAAVPEPSSVGLLSLSALGLLWLKRRNACRPTLG